MLPPRWQGDVGASSLFPLGDPGPFSFFLVNHQAGGRVDWLGERAGTEGVVVENNHTRAKKAAALGREKRASGRRSRLSREGGLRRIDAELSSKVGAPHPPRPTMLQENTQQREREVSGLASARVRGRMMRIVRGLGEGLRLVSPCKVRDPTKKRCCCSWWPKMRPK